MLPGPFKETVASYTEALDMGAREDQRWRQPSSRREAGLDTKVLGAQSHLLQGENVWPSGKHRAQLPTKR